MLTGTPSRLLTCSQSHSRSTLIEIHEMPASDGGLDLDQAAEAYARELGDRRSSTSACSAWDQTAMWPRSSPSIPRRTPRATSSRVRASPKPPPERISLTLPVINRSQEVWFVVSGADKAAAAKMALLGAGPVQVPAAGVSGVERTLWLLDRDAAAELPADLATARPHLVRCLERPSERSGPAVRTARAHRTDGHRRAPIRTPARAKRRHDHEPRLWPHRATPFLSRWSDGVGATARSSTQARCPNRTETMSR